MSPRTCRWVERGLLSPACGPCLGQSLFGVCVYVTSVPARPCHCAGRAKRGRLPGLAWGGGVSLCCFIPLTPLLGAGGWADPWRACWTPGGILPMVRLSAGVPPAPGACWLASRARRGMCLSVHSVHTPFGWPWCPLLQQFLTPLCVNAHVGHGGFPCRSQTQDLVSRLWVSFFLAPSRVVGGMKMGAAVLPLPPPVTATARRLRPSVRLEPFQAWHRSRSHSASAHFLLHPSLGISSSLDSLLLLAALLMVSWPCPSFWRGACFLCV